MTRATRASGARPPHRPSRQHTPRAGLIAVFTATLAIAVAGVALPAGAHEEIAPATVVVGKPTYLTLSAANEKKVGLVGLDLAAPSGISFGEAVRSPAGWTAEATESKVTWKGGTVDPGHFEQWGIELEGVDQPGTYTFTFTLHFADGSTEDSQVPVTATAAGATTTTAAPSQTTTTAASAPSTTSPAPTSITASGSDDAKDRANVALGVAIGAGVVALIAIVVGLLARRRAGGEPGPVRGPAGASGAGGAGAGPSGEQDW